MTLAARSSLCLLLLAAIGAAAWIVKAKLGPEEFEPPLIDFAALDRAGVDREVRQLVEHCDREARTHPRRVASHLNLAMACHANGLLHLATPAYQRALELDPGNAMVWFLLATVQAEEGDLESALQSLEQSIALNNTHAPSHWQRGFWLLDMNRIDDAQSAFQEARRLDPNSAAACVGLARAFLQRRQHDLAADVLEGLLARTSAPPNEPYVRQLLGAAKRSLAQIDQARGHLLQPTAADVVWPDPWLEIVAQHRTGYRAGIAKVEELIGRGEANAAIQQIENILRQKPNDVTALIYLARAHLAVNQRDPAIAALQKAITASPDFFATHVNLSQAFERHDSERCIHHAQQAVRLNPMLGATHRQLGRAFALANRPAESAAALAQAVQLGASDADTRLLLGQALMELRQWSDAERVLNQALESAPHNAAIYVALGRAKAEQGQLDRAMQLLGQANQLNPNEPSLRAAVERVQQLRAAPRQSPQRSPPSSPATNQ